MKKSVLIVEDDEVQQKLLKKLVLEVNGDVAVYTAGSLNPAYKILLEKTIDAFLVDIILDTKKPGDTSGIRLVEKIRTIPKYMFTPVLFISALEDATKYTYTYLNCLGYVEKPFSLERVKKLVEKALYFSTYKENDASYCFRKEGILYPVKVRDILYMSNANHQLNVYLTNGSRMTFPYKTCRQLLEEVDTNCLFQCNRGTIINKDYILNLDVRNRYITMKGTMDKVEIGITFRKNVLAEYGL